MKSFHKVFYTIISLCFAVSTTVCANQPDRAQPHPDHKQIAQTRKAQSEKLKKKQRMEFAEALDTLIQKQAWKDALDLFDSLSVEEKGEASIQNLKIAVLISQGDIAEAERIAKQVEKANPHNIDVLYTLSMIAQAKHDDKMRTKYLQKILTIDKDNPQALYEQGLDFYSNRQYKSAQKMFAQVLNSHPDNVNALIWMGKIYYLQNKLSDAETYYIRALQIAPQNSLAIAELARIYSETDRMKDAITEIQRAIELSPDSAHYWSDLGSYNLHIGRKQEALEAFSEAIKLIPDSHFVHIYLAGLNDDLGNKAAAIKHYKEVNRLYPQYYFAHESLGVLLFEKHDWEGAYTAFINALNHAPKKTEYVLMAALSSYKSGNKNAAKDLLKKYLKTLNRKKNETDYYLCRLFLDFAGDTDVNMRIQKLKSESEKLPLLFYLAAFYQMSGKNRLAEKYYIEITTTEYPNFFEYRLAVSELEQLKI